MLRNIELAQTKSRALDELRLRKRRFGLVTVHRPVNTDGDALKRLLTPSRRAVEQLELVFPGTPAHARGPGRHGLQGAHGLAACRTAAVPRHNPADPERCCRDHGFWWRAERGRVPAHSRALQCATKPNGPKPWTWVSTGWSVMPRARRIWPRLSPEVLKARDPFGAKTLKEIRRQYGSGDAAEKFIRDCVDWLS